MFIKIGSDVINLDEVVWVELDRKTNISIHGKPLEVSSVEIQLKDGKTAFEYFEGSAIEVRKFFNPERINEFRFNEFGTVSIVAIYEGEIIDLMQIREREESIIRKWE